LQFNRLSFNLAAYPYKARGALLFITRLRLNPLNLTLVNTSVGKPANFPALYIYFGEQHERSFKTTTC
jgi:hypothetical protein